MNQTQEVGAMTFVLSMRWQNSLSPYGTVSYYAEEELIAAEFDGFADLLFQMDTVCDEQGHPQRDTVLRSFGKHNIPVQAEIKSACANNCSRQASKNRLSVSVMICMRQHSSMQGFIQTPIGKHFFRSEMELMKLLSEMLRCRVKTRAARKRHDEATAM